MAKRLPPDPLKRIPSYVETAPVPVDIVTIGGEPVPMRSIYEVLGSPEFRQELQEAGVIPPTDSDETNGVTSPT
jgi:hypothetical protein